MVRRLNVDEIAGAILDLAPRVMPHYACHAQVNAGGLALAWAALGAQGTARAYGLFLDSELHGLLLGLVVPCLLTGERQGIEYLWVAEPPHRGRAVGLLREFEKDCKADGCRRMVCGSSAWSVELDSLYEKLGYRPHAKAFSKEI